MKEDAKFAERLGVLRSLLIQEHVLVHNERKRFTPQYNDIETIEMAIEITSQLGFLLTGGIPAYVIGEALKTQEGALSLKRILLNNRLIPHLNEHVSAEMIKALAASADLQLMVSMCLDYPELIEWVSGNEQCDLEDALIFSLNLQTAQKDSFRLLVKALELAKTDLNLLLDSFSFQELFQILSNMGHTSSEVFLTKIFLVSQGEHHTRAKWGTILNQLDFITQSGMVRDESETEWELKGAKSFYRKKNEHLTINDLDKPGLRKAASTEFDGNKKLVASSYHSVLPDPELLNNIEQEDLYNYLEDEHHPTNYLRATLGVEAEVTPNLALDGKYDLLESYVLIKGETGFDCELSARYVHNVHSLLAMYQKFFDSGLIDTLNNSTYSLHWNLGTRSKRMTVQTFSIGLLTGLMSGGRNDKSVANLTVSHPNERRYEWKQGDLINSESFHLGAEILHAIASAQKAQEIVSEMDAKFYTDDQYQLSAIYTQLIEDVRTVLEAASGGFGFEPEKASKFATDILEGTEIGMRLSKKILFEVYPTNSSFVEVDPAAQLQTEQLVPKYQDPDRQFVRAMSFYVVGEILAITKDVRNKVDEVILKAEESHHTLIMQLAQKVSELSNEQGLYALQKEISDIAHSYPRDQMLTAKDHYMTKKVSDLSHQLCYRFENYLLNPALQSEEQDLLESSIKKLARYRKRAGHFFTND